jgi:hypothetical protein
MTENLQAEKSARHPGGRPTKKTEQTVNALMQVIATGAPYVICCRAVGIHFDTFMGWKQTDAEFAAKVEQASAKAALRLLGKIEKQADQNFAAASWILERRFPEIFSRPEVQLNLIQQNNVALNSLSITISAEEVKQLEDEAAPERERVKQMFAAYRQGAVDYGQDENQRILDVDVEQAETESTGDEATQESVRKKFARYRPEEPVAQPPIIYKEGAEKSSAFWDLFANGDPQRTVEYRTAVFVAKEIIRLTVGPRFAQSVSFDPECLRVEDVLTEIQRLSGPAGYQLLLKRSGYVASP